MSELAEKLIAESLKTKNPYLDLGNCGLDGTEDDLYKPLRDAKYLETLIFSNYWKVYDEQIDEWIGKSSRNTGKANRMSKVPDFLPVSLKALVLAGSYKSKGYICEITALVNLKLLEFLNLNWNQIQNINPLKSLVKISILNLGANQIQDVSALEALSSLKVLNLGSNRIESFEEIKSLKNLINLKIPANQLKSIEGISQAKEIRKIDLRVNKVEKIDLSNLKHLKELRFSGNPLSVFKAENLPQIQSLDFRVIGIEEVKFDYYSKNVSLKEITLVNLEKLNQLHFHSEPLEVLNLKNLALIEELSISDKIAHINITELNSLTKITLESSIPEDLSWLVYPENITSLHLLYPKNLIDLTFTKRFKNLTYFIFNFNRSKYYPPIYLAYLQSKGGKLGDYTHLPELPFIEKIWQFLSSKDEKNQKLAVELAKGQGWSEEEIQMYQNLL